MKVFTVTEPVTRFADRLSFNPLLTNLANQPCEYSYELESYSHPASRNRGKEKRSIASSTTTQDVPKEAEVPIRTRTSMMVHVSFYSKETATALLGMPHREMLLQVLLIREH